MEDNLENTTDRPPGEEQSSSDISQPPETVENISLSDALAGVFTEPGNTFEEVKKATNKNYWLMPIIILIVLAIVAGFLVMRDEELSGEIKAKQMQTVKERLQEQVKEGKMTQDQMNERMDQMEKGFSGSSPIFYVFTIVGPIMGIFIVLFFKGLVFWGAIKLLKGTVTYMLVITVLGLSSIIESIQTVINTALAIMLGRLRVNIGPILLFAQNSLSEPMSKLLSHIDLLTIWYFIILGIGLAKVSNLKTSKVIPAVFILWLIWVCISSFANLPFMGGF
ncbi:MAG: Yip1 family protein [Ignavibacteria bacterium]|jgi:hypothetical protein